jgi:hypothetical protein
VVSFEWRIVDSLDAPSIRAQTRWIPWTGQVVQRDPVLITWGEDCEDLEQRTTSWPVKPNIADPTWSFEERAMVFRPRQRQRPSLGLVAANPTPPAITTVVSQATAGLPESPVPHRNQPIAPTATAATYHQQPADINTSNHPLPMSIIANLGDALRGENEKAIWVQGLKIPANIDLRYKWCYPNLLHDGDAWEQAVIIFQTTKVASPLDDAALLILEQQRRLVRAWLTFNVILPPHKEDLYAAVNAVATILAVFVAARAGQRARACFLEEIEDAYHAKGFIDFPAAYKKHSKPTQQQNSQHQQGNGGGRRRNNPFRANQQPKPKPPAQK